MMLFRAGRYLQTARHNLLEQFSKWRAMISTNTEAYVRVSASGFGVLV